MINSMITNKWLIFLSALFISICIAMLNLISPLIVIGLVLGSMICLNAIKKPLSGLLIMVLMLPFIWTRLLDSQIAGITGLKVINILAVIVLFSFICFRKSEICLNSEKIFAFGLIIIFTISVFRATSYMSQEYHLHYNQSYNTLMFIQSHLIKPLLIFVPFLLIVLYIRSRDEISKIVNSLLASMLLLSVFLLILYVFFTPDKSNFEAVREGFASYLGMHGNDLSYFYIFTFPLMLVSVFNKPNAFSIITLILSVCTIGILYSRTAYLIIIISFLLFLIFTGRKKVLPYLICIFVIGYLLTPSTIISRALTGLDGNDLNYISAGRTGFWISLADEYSRKPVELLIGSGRYGFVQTDLAHSLSARNFLITHAHNMYIDVILDAGVFILAFFLFFFSKFFIRITQTFRISNNKYYREMLCGVFITIIAYLISGVTGMTFFPNTTNTFFWIVMGLGLTIIYSEPKPNKLNIQKPTNPNDTFIRGCKYE